MKLIAIRDGFYAGTRRRAGTEFDFIESVERDGKKVAQRLPKWAAVAADKAAVAKARAAAAPKLNGDTKPAAAAAAAKAKNDPTNDLA